MELRGLEYESRGRNTEDTKRGGNNLNKEISVTRNVRVTTESNRVQRMNRIGLISIDLNRFDTFSNLPVIRLFLRLIPDETDEGFCCCE